MADSWVGKEVPPCWPAAHASIPRHRVGTAARPHPGRQWAAPLPGASPGAQCSPISLGPGVRDVGSGREAERAVTQEREMIETFLL